MPKLRKGKTGEEQLVGSSCFQAGAKAERARIIEVIEEYGKDSTGVVGAVLGTIKPALIEQIKSQPQKKEEIEDDFERLKHEQECQCDNY